MNKDLKPTNNKNQPHGYWEQYWDNGHTWFKCVYINGKEIGFEELYVNDDGKVTVKRYYL